MRNAGRFELAVDLGQPLEGPSPERLRPLRAAPALDRLTAALLARGPGCGKAKREGRHPARQLYTGALFRAQLAHAEATADEVLILSAFHGVVEPDQELLAYDRTLNGATLAEREHWASRVLSALDHRYPGLLLDVVVYAGAAYADPIEAAIRRRRAAGGGFSLQYFRRPLGRLPVGKRLAWFRRERLEPSPGRYPDAPRCPVGFCCNFVPRDADGSRKPCPACVAKKARQVERARRCEEPRRRVAAKEERAERRQAERAARQAARAQAEAAQRERRLSRDAERARRQREASARNYLSMIETARRELERNGGHIPVHSAGWVAYRGGVYEGRTFDRALADAAAEAAAGTGTFAAAPPA